MDSHESVGTTRAPDNRPWQRGIRLHHLAICAVTLIGCLGLVFRVQSASSVAYDVLFSNYDRGSPLKWLANKGFQPQRDADDQSRITLTPTGEFLKLETKRQAAGLLLSKVDVPEYTKIRIKWGVDVFPPGASYAKGVRSEAIMVYVFFGNEKLPSGHFLVPNSPYFIGLFLSDSDPIGEGFKGRLFHAGGRYVCADHAQRGQLVITEYPIAEDFKQLFGQTHAPAISALGIAIDTENAKGNGVAKSFISEIELLR